MTRYRLSGDDDVGRYEPEDFHTATFPRLEAALLDQLRSCTGLAATVSDVLDEHGQFIAASASALVPRHTAAAPVVGQAQTLRYLPSRRHVLHEGYDTEPARLAHLTLFGLCLPGDVAIIEATTDTPVSVLGGLAAAAAVEHGLGGIVVDGAVRDVDQIEQTGLALWSRSVTPRSGKSRMEAISINGAVRCGDVQVQAGDLVVADQTGVCFIPVDIAPSVAARVLEVTASERDALT